MRTLITLSLVLLSATSFCQDYNALKQQLESMNRSDQELRILLDSLVRKEKRSWDHPSIQELLPKAARQDSANLATLKVILDQHGWPGIGQVGKLANQTAFLIIQHADSATMVRYFPLLAQSYELGQSEPQHYAMMLDRILTDKNEKQIFGTQLQRDDKTGTFFPFPVADEKGLDNRRKKMGLPPMKEYLGSFNK